MKKSLLLLSIPFFLFSGCEAVPTDEPEPEPNPIAIIDTKFGEIEIELFKDQAPKTVENFVGLAEKGYYDGIIFHRVMDGFMIQGGDPTGTGRGGESFLGGMFENEISLELSNERGTIAMANAGIQNGKATNRSQFFINLVDNQRLDGHEDEEMKDCSKPRTSCHTVFGKVISGMEVVDTIGEVAVGSMQNKPVTDIPMTVQKNEDNTVVISTRLGDMTLKLYPEKAPKTVENFLGLAEKGYYDGIIFHRVIDGFMIQGGDPTGTGRGGESLWGEAFEDEFHPEASNVKGTISMANAGPNTNGSQFFINVVDNTSLDGRHSVFGEVIEGIEVAEAIAKAPTQIQDKPLEDIEMKVSIKK